MTSYTCDEGLAVKLDAGVGVKIETSGAYVGHFGLARERVAGTGTKGIEFVFETDEGQVARNLSLWLVRATGERIEYSHGLLSALMVCLGLKQIDTSTATVELWDRDQGGRVATQVEVFAALMNQPIGVVLRREEREWEGQMQVSMKLIEFFDPTDRSTATEILNGARSGKALERVLENLKDRTAPPPLRRDDFQSPPLSASAPARVAEPSVVSSPDASFDDQDIPF